jgi:polyphosphate kinase 2
MAASTKRGKGAQSKSAPNKSKSAPSKTSKTRSSATPAKRVRRNSASEKINRSILKADASAMALLSHEELGKIASRKGLIQLLKSKELSHREVRRVLRFVEYELELRKLQVELVKLQRDVQLSGRRVAIIFEGRDAAGKGGCIRRFIEHLNPRTARVVALTKPTETERGQWYFQRYSAALPNRGEICFFDRSWYNRAVVEPVMQFCTKGQYQQFMRQVPEFEHMLYEDGIEMVKFWFSISKREQEKRFRDRKINPLKQWKISPVDEEAQERWDLYTKYKERMFSRTHTTFSPWIIVKANSKKRARLESIRYVLSRLPYDGKDTPGINIAPDPSVVRRFHRSVTQIDR